MHLILYPFGDLFADLHLWWEMPTPDQHLDVFIKPNYAAHNFKTHLPPPFFSPSKVELMSAHGTCSISLMAPTLTPTFLRTTCIILQWLAPCQLTIFLKQFPICAQHHHKTQIMMLYIMIVIMIMIHPTFSFLQLVMTHHHDRLAVVIITCSSLDV